MSRILPFAVNFIGVGLSVVVIIWLFILSLKRSVEPGRLILKWVVSLLLGVLVGLAVSHLFKRGFAIEGMVGAIFAITGVFLGLVYGIIMAIMWREAFIDLIANPIASLYDGGSTPPEPKPYYSVAISKRKRNKPLEAIVAVREQLAKFPNDFEGVMLLASIQAEDTKDLPSAEITFNHFCDRPDAPPKQVAAAYTQLADWHLKLAQDSDSARVALEKIIAKFPDTELSLVAAQRIAHLGGTEKILLAAHDRQVVSVPKGVNNVGLLESSRFLVPEEIEPAKLAAAYARHLEQHPDDTEAREKLAVLHAHHYHRLDLATMELEQLAAEPNHPPKRAAHWLNLLADLQIHEGADYETIRATLEKIIERFPDLPVAHVAQRRLGHLKLELKGKTETPGVKLGVYEQNIGLKGDRYYSPRQL